MSAWVANCCPSTKANDDMSGVTFHVKEVLYEIELRFTNIEHYGVPLEQVFTPDGIPSEGARIDFTFEGSLKGAKLNGTMKGVDYVYYRHDGRSEIHIHARIETPDGAAVAFKAEGVSTIYDGTTEIRYEASLQSSYEQYMWLNGLPIWGAGSVDPHAGTIKAQGFIA